MVVTKSSRHTLVQIIDDVAGKTLVSASTMEPELRALSGDKSAKAVKVGELWVTFGDIVRHGRSLCPVFHVPLHVTENAAGLTAGGDDHSENSGNETEPMSPPLSAYVHAAAQAARRALMSVASLTVSEPSSSRAVASAHVQTLPSLASVDGWASCSPRRSRTI